MGVPKFYRWISERYPCLSEVVKEFQLPEFDNLYLDMNGIIHVCSHPDDENPHFRITEEKIFTDICHYIDFLFRMIKPRKVFFMAVDGVAPRAKMNQQRGRRFKSAREAEELIEKAKQAGETLPTEKRFDSNCITPGTPFMVRLQNHLKYFVVDKVSNDPLWHDVSVYLSGHETPGEGEHKVMDYIRWSKSQPGYDGNTRHCLYGLDADLMMLGLTSHEPHFSLLREEVRFGSKKDRNKRPVTPEETTFHLLHLSLFRDYLGYEFSPLKDKLSFPWDLERLIDDWIMIGFLVGNDFIPHLPTYHIHHDALPTLWNAYMKVLPRLGGYINDGGHLNLSRLEKFFEELATLDQEKFEGAFSDMKYLENKIGGKSINESAGKAAENLISMKKLKPFKLHDGQDPSDEEEDECGDEDEEELGYGSDDEDDEDNTVADEFVLHKKDYYMSKLNYKSVGPEVLQELAEGYVRAIQWILLYYFEGVPSWSWYYPHHYSPYISDIKGFKDMKLEFDLSSPFLPFEQLMAVLPAASKELLPPALQPLMTESTSPVIDYYPVNFDTDLNGKQQPWEAVVLIPFINEQRLLTAMKTREPSMTQDEHARNTHGPHLMYRYTSADMGFFPSTLPDKCPDIHSSRAKCTPIEKDTFHISSRHLMKGLGKNVDLNVYYPGFPTLWHLPHSYEMKRANVKVFQHNSRNSSMVLHVEKKPEIRLEELADDILGQTIFVGWPHIHEARVVAVANESYKIELLVESGKTAAAVSFDRKKLGNAESMMVGREALTIKERLLDRFAINVGNTEILIYASPMTGRTYTYGNHGNITLDKQFASQPVPFAYQMTIRELQVQESSHTTFKTLEEVFPQGSTIFMLGTPHYGAQGKVLEVLGDSARVRIALEVTVEPDLQQLGHLHMRDAYMMTHQGAQVIGCDSHILSRITGSVFVERVGQKNGRVNVGLNLKLNKREEEVPGYTRKEENGWTYSHKCLQIVSQYINKYPNLWRQISVARSFSDAFTEDDLFPKEGSVKMDDVIKFIDALPSSKAPKMKFGSEILDNEQVARIENITGNISKKPVTVKMKIKPRLLFRPLADLGTIVPDPQTDNFLLYDRIIVVKPGYSVPFGKRGTIIGIPVEEGGSLTPHSVYDVVFDEPFTGGITLRCSPNKGYRVPGSAMLNITYGEFRKNRPVSERPTAGVWNRGRNNNSSDGMKKSDGKNVAGNEPVAWDSKRQPMFGHVFSGHGKSSQSPKQGMVQPKFVTPKVQAPQPVLASKGTVKTDSVDFNSVWKSLQNQKMKGNEASSSQHQPQQQQQQQQQQHSLQSAGEQQPPAPIKILSKSQPSQSMQPIPLVQSLFANPSNTGPQVVNSEFLAMFNSLKTEVLNNQQNSNKMQSGPQEASGPSKEALQGALTITDIEAAELAKQDAQAKEADNAIKQMLKIGTPSDCASPSASSPRSAAASASSIPPLFSSNPTTYGRQVSLKELFDEANRQLKPQERKPSPANQGAATVRDSVQELSWHCVTNGVIPPPAYDFRHPPKQMTFIASVLVCGRRYEGSPCPTKEEAAKSAASIALLCLMNPNPGMLAPFFSGAQRPGIHPLLSQNSAFSPIRLPGQPPRIQTQQQPRAQAPQPDMMRPPPLLTPRHFASQPPLPVLPHQPPSLQMAPYHRLPMNISHQHPALPNMPPQQPSPMFNQLQQQLQRLAHDLSLKQQQVNANMGYSATDNNRPSQQPMGISKPHVQYAYDTTVQASSTSSAVNPFIPLQVSRNQKAPKVKKDLEKVVDLTMEESHSEDVTHNTAPENDSKDRIPEKDFGFSTQPFSPNGVGKEELSVADTLHSSIAVAASTSPQNSGEKTEKPVMPKKKSRLAASFGNKKAGSNSNQQSLSQTK